MDAIAGKRGEFGFSTTNQEETMGEGGRVRLVNNTSVTWKRVHQHSYQMNSWDFPETIEPGNEGSSYVEWDQGWLTHEGDDAGEARYELEGTGYQFEVQARNHDGFVISVVNFNLPRGDWGYGGDQRLGWQEDGTVSFTMPGPE